MFPDTCIGNVENALSIICSGHSTGFGAISARVVAPCIAYVTTINFLHKSSSTCFIFIPHTRRFSV